MVGLEGDGISGILLFLAVEVWDSNNSLRIWQGLGYFWNWEFSMMSLFEFIEHPGGDSALNKNRFLEFLTIFLNFPLDRKFFSFEIKLWFEILRRKRKWFLRLILKLGYLSFSPWFGLKANGDFTNVISGILFSSRSLKF